MGYFSRTGPYVLVNHLKTMSDRKIIFDLSRDISQQTFVFMKTSFAFVFRRRLQDALIKTNIFILVICLQDVFKTFSRRLQNVFKTFSKLLAKTSSRNLEDVFKTSLRHLQRRLAKTFLRRLQSVSKTSCKNVFKTFWRRLQDIFKPSCKDVFKTFSRRIIELICSW